MLSIIVPVYKVEKYLNQCVDSILAQTYNDFELILVDDGSPDRCPEICDEYAQKDVRVKVIHKENGGTQTAIIEGLKASGGGYIGFVDSDDWIEPDMYEVLMGLMEKYDLDCAICGFREVREEGGRIVEERLGECLYKEGLYDSHNIEDLHQKLLPDLHEWKGMRTVRWDKVFKREKIYDIIVNAGQNIVYGEDSLVIFPALMNCERVYFTKKALYFYRKRANAATTTFHERYLEAAWKLIDMYAAYEQILGEQTILAVTLRVCVNMTNMILNCVEGFFKKRKYILLIFKNDRVRKMVHSIKKYQYSSKNKKWIYVMRFRMAAPLIILKRLPR